MQQKKVYITGIAGFIGFHLARRLSELGIAVSGCDNFNPYYDVALKELRATLLQKGGVTVDRCDIRSLSSFSESTHVVHLAAQAGVRYSLEAPQAYVDANLDGFVHILELCRHQKPQKFIFASSSSVYGMSEQIPFSESDPCDKPASLYAATKRSNELLAYSYHHLFGIPTIGLRFFTVYGPYGRPDMAYFSFTEAILKDRPIALFNQGQMERDFTYVDDIVEGIIASLDHECYFELFNLGNDRPEKLTTLISLIEAYLGKKAQKEMKEMQPGDVVSTWAEISKSRKALGYSPKISLEVGIERFIQWHRSYSKSHAKGL